MRTVRRWSLWLGLWLGFAVFIAPPAVKDVHHATAQESGFPWEVPNGPIHEGVEVQIHYPMQFAFANTETRGLGNCVFTSMKHASIWQHIPSVTPIISWLFEGGGYPEKVSELMAKNAPDVPYVQYEGQNVEPIIELALKTRRIVCATYGYGELYGEDPRTGKPRTIAHMVNIVHLDSRFGAIIDNNDPEHVTWMAREELLKRVKHPNGSGWVLVFLNPPPPPVPTNM